MVSKHAFRMRDRVADERLVVSVTSIDLNIVVQRFEYQVHPSSRNSPRFSAS